MIVTCLVILLSCSIYASWKFIHMYPAWSRLNKSIYRDWLMGSRRSAASNANKCSWHSGDRCVSYCYSWCNLPVPFQMSVTDASGSAKSMINPCSPMIKGPEATFRSCERMLAESHFFDDGLWKSFAALRWEIHQAGLLKEPVISPVTMPVRLAFRILVSWESWRVLSTPWHLH